MLSSRTTTLLRTQLSRTAPSRAAAAASVNFSSLPTTSVPETQVPPHSKTHPDLDDSSKNSVQIYTSTLTSPAERNTIYKSDVMVPDPVLPAKPEEISALDSAMNHSDPYNSFGAKRTVVIRQEEKNPQQSPSTRENHWIISFQDDGAMSRTWSNPLMGWVSGNDAMGSTMVFQMKFKNAKEAVYFAKKRGWKYEVEKPILRHMRTDGAQYQDNFLPQAVAYKIRKDNTKCDHWYRPAAGASHYFRPLKYHGDGRVIQHGPNGGAPIDPDAESYYKMR